MAINISIEISPSFYIQTDPNIHRYLINETVEESGELLLDYIKSEAPVRTGRLRDGHSLQKGEGWINIQNEAYYWKYVVYRGNDYISRGLLQFINDRIIEEKYGEKINRL